jgi:outer membrane biosynthesis protein TonB
MTRSVSSHAFFGLAGIVLVSLAATACAGTTGPDALVATPSGAATSPTRPASATASATPIPSTPKPSTPKPRPRPKAHPKPKPRPVVVTHPRTTAPPAPPPPAPKPKPRPAPKPKPAPQSSNCDPSYPDVCLQDGIGDYDCSSGSGNGPNYVSGPVRVTGSDPFRLDADGDGVGCERG